MIKSFPTPAAYAAAGAPTDESRVAQIQSTGEIRIDGVNVLMDRPTDVCAVLYDADGKDRFVRYDTIVKSLLPGDWTHVGYAFSFDGKRYKVLDKEFPTSTYKWLAVWQHTITSITAATIKFWLHCKGDYAAFLPVEVTLTDSSNDYMNAQSVTEINAVLETVGNTGNVGYAKHGWWAYLEDGKIIIQCDLCEDYRQYQTSDSTHALVGCTMALTVWGDMPASSAVFRKTGTSTSSGLANFEKSLAYYSAGGSNPSANVAVNNATIVNRASFNTSQYCADLRAFYGTYEAYILANMTMWPHPEYGAFALIDADEMTARYANVKATLKDGSEVWKFPALHTAVSVGYGTGKYAVGRWHLSDITDGTEYMRDEVLAKLAEAQTRMGTTVITNSVTRWFARRSNAGNAWLFSGPGGYLYSTSVYGANRCQAVTLCDLSEAK